ncbi:MAG: helix-turn-helix domain-containing protein [Pyrinomonadaceae bacterium]
MSTRLDERSGVISVWRPAGLRQLELHRGVAVHRPVPRHWHEEFQLCLVEDGEGDLTYRGARHLTPPASLFIVHPGEIHANSSFHRTGCSYRTLFVETEVLRGVAAEMCGRDRGVPFFPSTMIFAPDVIARFVRLHIALEEPASLLERETLLQSFSTDLLARFGEHRTDLEAATPGRASVARAREYLAENYAENVSLRELARLANLSPFHFSRLFSEQCGMPPHAFQNQVRVTRAKELLVAGDAVARVAAQTGFADQSHLTRQFKRLTGITPGLYQQSSKNVQDASHAPR